MDGLLRGARLLTGVLVATFVLAGCSQPPAVNPWRDDSIPPSAYGTASGDAILSANVEPAVRQRDYPEMLAPVARYEVPHYPLWWEDPFEDQGDNNNTFAWTWQDYFDMPYGLGRFGLNTAAWPISAIVTPPGTPMVSDGVVEKVHDAKRGISPDPNASLEDFVGVAETAIPGAPTDEKPAPTEPKFAPTTTPVGP